MLGDAVKNMPSIREVKPLNMHFGIRYRII
jgi:hypothetical protein